MRERERVRLGSASKKQVLPYGKRCSRSAAAAGSPNVKFKRTPRIACRGDGWLRREVPKVGQPGQVSRLALLRFIRGSVRVQEAR